MADSLDTTTKILALSTTSITLITTLVKMYTTGKDQDTAKTKDGTLAPRPPESVDSSLHAIALFVAATASLSFSAALLSGSDRVSVWSYVLSALIVALYVGACVAPIAVYRDLRHLVWVCVAGLIPTTSLPILAAFRGNPAEVLIGDLINVQSMLLIWVFLTAALMTYSISNGDRFLGKQSNWLAVNVTLVGLSVFALGLGEVETITQNPRAHAILSPAAAKAQGEISGLQRPRMLRFYQLASEMALASSYTTWAAHPEEDEDSALSRRRASGPKSQDAEAKRDGAKELWDSLPFADKKDLLNRRLNFIHPVPRTSEQKYPAEIPGISAEDRFEYFQEQMVISVLNDNPRVEALYHEYTYSSAIDEQVTARHRVDSEPGELNLGRLFSRPPRRPALDAYPEPYALVYGLPRARSAAALISFYRDLAISGYRSGNEGQREDLRPLLDEVEGLEPDQRTAFLQFVVRDPTKQQGPLLAKIFAAQNNPAVQQLVSDSRPPAAFAHLLDEHSADAPQPKSPADVAFVDGINKILNKDDIATLRGLLNRVNTLLLPVGLVFKPDPLRIADQLWNHTSGADRTSALAIIDDPTAEGVKELSREDPAITTALSDYQKLVSTADREGTLHNIALAIYIQAGPNALWWNQQLVDEANHYSASFGILVGSFICLWEVLIAGFLGRLFGKALVTTCFAADRLLRHPQDALACQGQADAQWAFVGRDSLMNRLQRLSLRASGTIGLVGRRGVGKTRVMRELFKRHTVESGIPVWLDCPTAMSQEDFVQTISERVVEVVERRFATYAEIPDQSQRRADGQVIRGLSICVGILGLSYLVCFFSLRDPFPEFTLASSLCAGLGTGLFFIRVSSLLASTRSLRRNLGATPELFEWRSAYDAILTMTERLRLRRAIQGPAPDSRSVNVLALILAFLSPMALLGLFIASIDNSKVLIAAAIACVVGFAGYVVFRRVKREEQAGSSLSSVSFTLVFRKFIMELTEQIRRGALGPFQEGDVLVVFIDELDKIVDRDELRAFVRVLKSVFDIPGTRYFLSISQDAYRDMVLGAALGKNEFDSSFDHIELVGPMEFQAAKQLARTYLANIGKSVPEDTVIDTIVLMGKGVPRDILRKCDGALLLAGEDAAFVERLLQAERDRLLSAVQYLAGLDDRIASMFTDVRIDTRRVMETIDNVALDDRVLRILAENLVYCRLLLETDTHERGLLAGHYYDFLYTVPILTAGGIRSAIHAMFREKVPAAI